jgi:asparagine synthase (glutamine-hydrolysing)
MCGFAGVLSGDLVHEESLRAMITCIRHRGPDDQGVWVQPEAGIGLAHARLSIVDLSSAGHQPMASAVGRFVISFNGEIYNHGDLRGELQASRLAPAWRGHSDTETLLAGFEAWGIEGTVTRTVGMFAFAVWDRRDRVLTLVRDRLGEKPLYYGWQGNTFLFGSDVKAFRSHPAFRAIIDREALTLLLRHNCIPAPFSIYQGIRKQEPGTLLSVSLDQRDPVQSMYWDAQCMMERGMQSPFRGSPADAVAALEEKLSAAVRGQLMSDVPLGAFLSGGVDSSVIVALMQRHSPQPVRTFTIGFREIGYDEAEHARAVARRLGTDHTELYVSPQQAQDVIPRLPGLYAEPFADSSQIPTFLVSELARRDVTVALSGDGGDELFGGYNRYLLGRQLWGALSRVPAVARGVVGRRIASVHPDRWNSVIRPLQRFLPRAFAHANVGDKLVKGADVLSAKTPGELYHLLVSHWWQPQDVVIDGVNAPTRLTESDRQPRTDGFVHRMMALDLMTYLPDDILVKVDRAAMGVSLETRVPLLDHRIVEFAWQLPLDYKVRGGEGKWPLRQVLYKYVPKELIERPKMGFGIPLDSWLRGPLRPWAEDLLGEERLRREGYFHPAPIRQKWMEHVAGVRNWQYHLWNVLMFQAWLAGEA